MKTLILPNIPPGAWKYHLGRGANPRMHVQTSGGYQIASTPELERHPSAVEENDSRRVTAQAISAVPAMLAALADAYAALHSDALLDRLTGDECAATGIYDAQNKIEAALTAAGAEFKD